TQPGLERSIHPALVPPGPTHIHGCHSTALNSSAETAALSGLLSSVVLDYLIKVSGTAFISSNTLSTLPLVRGHPLDQPLLLRAARLNCLTADYALLWRDLYDADWAEDSWTMDLDSPWADVL